MVLCYIRSDSIFFCVRCAGAIDFIADIRIFYRISGLLLRHEIIDFLIRFRSTSVFDFRNVFFDIHYPRHVSNLVLRDSKLADVIFRYCIINNLFFVRCRRRRNSRLRSMCFITNYLYRWRYGNSGRWPNLELCR